MSSDSFAARGTFQVLGSSRSLYRLDAVPGAERLPYSLKVLLENLLRHEDGHTVTRDQIAAVARWDPRAEPATEVQFTPGIEAEAAMLGRPVSMLLPQVVGVRLTGGLPAGSTATDLVLTIAERLRAHGVVGSFVEFHGPGVAEVPVANRATIGNMSPEYGATCAIFPIDSETLSYLRLTGRDEQQVAPVEAYAKEQGLWHDPGHTADYSESLDIDLSAVVPSIAGPKRPQDRIALADAPGALRHALASSIPGTGSAPGAPGADAPPSARSASTWLATAAPPASATPGR